VAFSQLGDAGFALFDLLMEIDDQFAMGAGLGLAYAMCT
jgi:hypothetical protein